jgi:hypothetical protein
MMHRFKVSMRCWRGAGWASLVLVVLLLFASIVSAAGGYDLSWWTVDAGGGTSSGSAYTLCGTAGQPDAGAMSGGTYTLAGGLWAGTGEQISTQFRILLPLIVREP